MPTGHPSPARAEPVPELPGSPRPQRPVVHDRRRRELRPRPLSPGKLDDPGPARPGGGAPPRPPTPRNPGDPGPARPGGRAAHRDRRTPRGPDLGLRGLAAPVVSLRAL